MKSKSFLVPALLLACGVASATNLFDPSVSSTSTLDGSSIELDGTLHDTNGNPAPWVVEVAEVMAAVAGADAEPRGLAYFTDAAALGPAYGTPPIVICGPGDADQAHRTDESCSVAALEASAEGIFEIARRWCGL